MQLKVRSFYIFLGLFPGAFLGSGIEDAGIDQPGKDGIQVIVKLMLPLDGRTDLVQAQIIIDLLEEKIAGIKRTLVLQGDGADRREGDIDRRIFFLALFIELCDIVSGPGIGVIDTIGFAYILFVTQSFDSNRGTFFVNISGFDNGIGFRMGRFSNS